MGVWVATMTRARSVHAIWCAQSVHGQYSVIRCPNIYVFGISTTNVVIWHYFGKDLRQFLKKIFFAPKGSPLSFRVICPLVFVNAKNPTPKFWFYHPPLTRGLMRANWHTLYYPEDPPYTRWGGWQGIIYWYVIWIYLMEAVLYSFYLSDSLSYCCKIYLHKEFENVKLLFFHSNNLSTWQPPPPFSFYAPSPK